MGLLPTLCFLLPGFALGQFGVNTGLLVDQFMLMSSGRSPAGGSYGSISDQWGWQAGLVAAFNGGQEGERILITLNYREIRFHTAGHYQVGPYNGYHNYFVRTSHIVLGVAVDARLADHWSLRPGLQVGCPLGSRFTGHDYAESYQAVLRDVEVDEHENGAPYSLWDGRLQMHLAWCPKGKDDLPRGFLYFGPSYGLGSYVEGSWKKARTLRFELGYGVWLK